MEEPVQIQHHFLNCDYDESTTTEIYKKYNKLPNWQV